MVGKNLLLPCSMFRRGHFSMGGCALTPALDGVAGWSDGSAQKPSPHYENAMLSPREPPPRVA